MKFQVATVVASVVVGFTLVASEAVTPVQRVIQLLEGMAAKGKEEKHDEEVQFARYKQFCDSTAVDKQHAIQEANKQIETLTANIEKYSANSAKLAREIAEHEGDIGAWDGDMKAATTVRGMDKDDFDAMRQDLSESVDALQRAISVLRKQAFNREQAEKPNRESFAQVSALNNLNLISQEAKQAINLFLAQEPPQEASGLAVQNPESHGYEFQSDHVIDILEKLHDKFIAERTDLEKQETTSRHAYDMLMQDLSAQTKQAQQDSADKTDARAARLQAKADAEGDLKDTTTTRDDDQSYLTELVALCEQKASDFESRQNLRADELTAIEQAIGVLSSAAVTGNAEKHLPSLLQRARGSALVHLRADASGASQARAAQYLQARAGELHSRVLFKVAARVEADPFAKVKQLIKDLIVRLMEEANDETTHHGWCNTELASNEQTRRKKTQSVETMHAEIDELEASISKLTQDIAELEAEVARVAEAVATATEIRTAEKATNAATVADAQEAQAAVAQALAILQEFYARAGDATALVQRQQPVAPEIFDSPYQGMQAENGGVVGMLQVIESDFARLEADTKASEAGAQQAHDAFMHISNVNTAEMKTTIEHKTAKQQDETQGLAAKKADLEGTQKELDAALAYFDKLKPSCVDATVDFDARVQRRKEEIRSLQEALRILNGEDLAA